jgi:hypothetical protein
MELHDHAAPKENLTTLFSPGPLPREACALARTDLRRGRTEGAVRFSDRGAGVSRGHSRSKPSVRSSGTLARKGRNGRGSHDRERAAAGPNDGGGQKASQLMGDRRPIIQYLQRPLAFITESRDETQDTACEGTESSAAKRGFQSPAIGGLVNRLTRSNRRVWTRMLGGVGGEEPRGSPLSRSTRCVPVAFPATSLFLSRAGAATRPRFELTNPGP